jgi:hypothetical protein
MTVRKPNDGQQTGRAERLAAALKANLKRRKAQARERAGAGDAAPQSDAAIRQDGGQDRESGT